MKIIAPLMFVLSLLVIRQPEAKATAVNVTTPPILTQTGGTLSVSSTCYKIDEAGVADCVQTQLGNPYKCGVNRFAPKCQSVVTTYFKSTGEVVAKPVVNTAFGGRYPGTGWLTYSYKGIDYGCQSLQATGSGGHTEYAVVQGCGKLISWAEFNALPKNSDALLLPPTYPLWEAPWLAPHYTAGYTLWSNDRNEVTDVSDYGFVVSDIKIGNFAYYMHAPLLCTGTCVEVPLPNLAINDFGDYVGGVSAQFSGVAYDLSIDGVTQANDINNAGEIAGQCGTIACIDKITPPVADNSCSGTGETINNLSPRGGWFSTLTGAYRVDYTQTTNTTSFGIGSVVDYFGTLDPSGVFCIATEMVVY